MKSMSVHNSVTHQALNLNASGMSGLTMVVELNKAESDLPPKSDKRAPLMATTGCPEPSNFSAWTEGRISSGTREYRGGSVLSSAESYAL